MNIENLTNPENILHISLNVNKSIFKDVFSKMEFIGAYEYILSAFKRYNIPTMNIAIENMDHLSKEYGAEKHNRRKRNMAPVSPQHEMFLKQFSEITDHYEPDLRFKTNKIDILGSAWARSWQRPRTHR
ncbi:hypothetical protein [Metallibacterium scheffleri]|uniref:hypothetical protein n=1 Tax=Metallibacterium scheffleri TaxID=993689 RepID=UPI0023F42F85|nr:hypothetical protein [Metallibacterium scheffleri]